MFSLVSTLVFLALLIEAVMGYPDWLVFDSKGIVGAGYFGNDWKLETGESAWRKE